MSHFPIRPAYKFALEKGLEREVAEVKAIPNIEGFKYTTGVRRAHMIELLEEHGILDEFIKEFWPDGNRSKGKARIKLYQKRRLMYEEISESDEEDDDSDDGKDDSVFAYERDLQNFLAKNLDILEKGLKPFSDERGSGIEYPVDGGRIDLLAKSADDRLVVIELKLSRGRNKAIGQLLYYMGWIDENLKPDKPCRGILIAKDIGKDIITATRRTKGVELFRYSLQVAVEPVTLD